MKENTLNIVVVGLLVLVLGLGGFLLVRPVIQVERVVEVGVAAGPTVYFPTEYLDALTALAAFTATGESRISHLRETGTVLTPATSSVITLTAAQLCDNPIVVLGDWTPAASGTAVLNLPTAGTIFSDCLTTNGDSFELLIYNDASASASSTLITAAASTTLYGFDTAEDIILGGSVALLKVWRKSATEMEVGIHNFVEAD